MAEPSKEASNTTYAKDVTGHAVKLTPEQIEDIGARGGLGQFFGQGISKEHALELAQKEADKELAETYGQGNAFGLGAIQGASFGFGAPMMLKISELTESPEKTQLRRHVMAGQKQMSGYVPGQIAGMGVSTLATGGLFNPLENAIGKLIPETTGLLGAAVRGGASLGARGGVEGALIGLGNATEAAAIQNKPLAAEALLAMRDGAILGGLTGAAFGSFSGALRGLKPKVAGVLESALAKGGGGSWAKELDSAVIKGAEEQLEKEGLNLSSEPTKIRQVARNNIRSFSKIETAVAKEFDRAASGTAPTWNQYVKAVKEEVAAPMAMSPGGLDHSAAIDSFLKSMGKVEVKAKGGFQQWTQRRQYIVEASRALPEDLGQKVISAYDNQMRAGMELAEASRPGLAGAAGRYQSAVAGRRIAEELETILDAKASAKAAPGSLGSQAIGYAMGVMGFNGLAKQVGQQAAASMWSMNAAAQASMAVTEAKETIGKAVKAYLRGRDLAGVTAGKYAAAQPKQKLTREAYDKEINDTYAKIGQSQEARIKAFMRATNSLPLSQAMLQKSNSAMQYLNKNLPPAKGRFGNGSGTLRPVPVPQTLDIDEHMFLRKHGPIKNPYSVFSELGKNKLSKESVDSLKNNWPELYGLMVEEVQQQVTDLRIAGDTLPMEKITQLSILLDQPLDSTLEKPFIQEVQMALNAPEQGQQPPAPMPMAPAQIDTYLTPAERIA